ncbi:glycine/betaine ABC transporter [candidate division GN15 bacterium]|nr:glycine/betaine ABC transporter [candidate division GN15 bacterium]
MALVAGCGEQAAEKKTVKLVYVNWAEGIAMTNLMKAIIEDELGHDVQLQVADVGPVYTSVAQGDNDAFLDAWLPVTHADYMDEFADQVVDYGYNYEGARIGLVVPSYVTISTIPEMNDHAEKFDGEIVGIDAGAGIMKATDKAIDTYGLNLELISSSGPAMTAALKDGVDNENWVAVTGWKPHWKFARWDLKFLDDPEGVYGAAENIHTIARQGLEEDMPMVAQLLKNFKMNDQQLGTLMGMIADSENADPVEVAREWKAQNMDLVNSWLPQN